MLSSKFLQHSLVKNTLRPEHVQCVANDLTRRDLADDDFLISIVPSPSITFDDGFRGAAYEVYEEMQARKIMLGDDLAAGVSAYMVREIPKPRNKKHNLSYELSLRINENPIRDYSLDRMDTIMDTYRQERETNPNFMEAHLGRENCSISLQKYISQDDASYSWMLVVRSYDVPASHELLAFINEPMNGHYPTIKEVYNSREYKNALKRGQYNRDMLAAEYAANTGITLDAVGEDEILGEYVFRATPFVTNLYNFIDSCERVNTRWTYIFYDHCFSTAVSKDGILFGRGRGKGYTIIRGNCPETNKSWYNKKTNNIFPMGYPKRLTRRDIYTNPSEAKLEITERNKFAHGSRIDCNHKMVPQQYHYHYADRPWQEIISTLGLQVTTEDIPWNVEHCYLGSQDPQSMPLEEIFHFSPEDNDSVLVPIESPFFMHEMNAGIVNLRHGAYPKIKLQDVYQGEPERGYVKINKFYADLIHKSQWK